MQLCALSGVSSWEDEVRDFLKEEAAPYADELRTDALGNLIVFKRGARPAGNKLMLCAHMDEVGLMVRKVTDEGVRPGRPSTAKAALAPASRPCAAASS